MKNNNDTHSNVIPLKKKVRKPQKKASKGAVKIKLALLFQWIAIIFSGYIVFRSCGLAK